MSYTLTSLTGSTIPSSGKTVSLQNGGSPGAVIVFNGSLVALIVDDSDGNQFFLPSNWADRYIIPQGIASIRLIPAYTVSGSGTNPNTISFVVLNMQDLARDRRSWPASLGANLGVASVSSITNDGNPAGTQVVEATASGDATSDVLLTNDGKLTLSGNLTCKGAFVDTNTLASVGSFNRTWDATADPSNWYPLLIATPSGATVNKVWWQAYNGLNGSWHWYNVTDNKVAFGLGPTSTPFTVISNTGVFTQVAGQATAGSFGVPVIVAQALRILVNTTNSTTILTYAVTTSGIYRINGYVAFNGTNSPVPIFTYQHTDPDTSNILSPKLVAASNNSTAVIQLGGSAQNQSQFNDALTATFAAKTGTNITVTYQNTTATPSDFVTAIVERLA